MGETQDMVKTTMEEIEKVFSTKTVFGEPMTFGDKTIIPLMSAGFGFGAGSGSGKTAEGMGGGAGVQPVGIIIIDANGVRIESVKHGIGAVIEKMTEKMPEICGKMMTMMAMKRHEMHHGGWGHGMHGMMEEKPEEEQKGKAEGRRSNPCFLLSPCGRD